MSVADGCAEILDPHQLVRDGTNQLDRSRAAPDPARAPVDERRAEHSIAFASEYSRYLNFVDENGAVAGDWHDFFATDVSAKLAVAAVDDVDAYRRTLKGWQRRLEDPPLPPQDADMGAALAAILDAISSLAAAIDDLALGLPGSHPLRTTIVNLVRAQLGAVLQRLLGYRAAGVALGVIDPNAAPPAGVRVLGRPIESAAELLAGPALSADWWLGAEVADWATFVAVDPVPYQAAYGPGVTVAERANHLATHHLFTSSCEAFLGAHARIVEGARAAVRATFDDDGHQPHYALFLAFLDALERTRDAANQLTARHLDFYYRDVLRLSERAARAGHAHVLVELAKHVASHRIPAGTLLKAGKDDVGDDAHFAVDRDLVANRASVALVSSLYRHRNTPTEQLPHADGRIFASPVSASADGLGADLTTVDGSWHPYANKVYEHGSLSEIRMPTAEIGFAVASHHLWLAEGTRRIDIRLDAPGAAAGTGIVADLRCRLTTAEGWLELTASTVDIAGGVLSFSLPLDGNHPAITGYDPAAHGYSFATQMPMLLATFRHQPDAAFAYDRFAQIDVTGVTVAVTVGGLKSLALSNDQGPIDAAKPFLAYGSTPRANSSLVIGSAEVFQKEPDNVRLQATWMEMPVAHGTAPTVRADVLEGGQWAQQVSTVWSVGTTTYTLGSVSAPPIEPVLEPDVAYTTASRAGFVRLRLSGGFGTDAYPIALATWVATGATGTAPTAPVLPTVASLSLDYTATQQLDLADPTDASGRYFHLTPFGHVEQSLGPGRTTIPMVPRFRTTGATGAVDSEAELYIGVDGVVPAQNLALLVQVVDGSANPLVAKPDEHVRWSYLRGGEWVDFRRDAVEDGTDGLLASGIVVLAIPDDASVDHTMLPHGLHWVRASVAAAHDAVCRVVTVAAQALHATYVELDNGSTSHTRPLPAGTITKLDPAHAEVKGVAQPFPTFGGRPAETAGAFYSRVSERLRHRDRAINLWDYEHLVLGAFPEVYQARCLNHTRYEPSSTGAGIYRELAPGHVTIVTIPDLAHPNPRDPLRPTTSLRVLGEIERFLAARTSCFVQLHVRNPRFEEVRAAMNVRFRTGVDETFHVNLLKQEITRWLSPWAYRSDERPSFNGRVAKSVLVDFVEERTYVDYVTDVRLTHIDPDTGAESDDLDEIAGSRAISVLVSVPADQHVVTPLSGFVTTVAERCACPPAQER